MISVISKYSEPRAEDHSPRTIALFCCVGLLVSFCLMASGIDMSASWV